MDPQAVAQPNMAAVQPQTSPQTQPQPTPTQGSNFSPSTVALTKAIGMAESGGSYNAGDNTGDGADSTGAFQMTPAFLQEWAPKAGVQYQPGMTLTPQQQDEIASSAVQTMSTTGDPAYPQLGKLNPAQIASAWNTGNPDMYIDDPSYGPNNAYGSIEGYVNKVGELYNQESSQNPVQGTTAQTSGSSNSQSSQPSWLSALEGVGLGGIGWLASEAAKPLQDATTDATMGAVTGEIADPAGGGIAGAGVGALGGIGQGIIADITGGGNNNQPPANGTDTTATPPDPNDPGIAADTGQNKATPETNPTPQSTTSTQSAPDPETQQQIQATQTAQGGITQMAQGTAGGRVFAQSPAGQASLNTMAAFGLVDADENGNAIVNKEKRQQALGEVSQLQDSIIGANGGTNSPLSVANYAGTYVGKDKMNTKADRAKAAKIIRDEIGSDSGGIPMNGQMSLADMRAAEKTHNIAATPSWKNPRPNAEMLAHKALAHGYSRAIRDKMEDKELYDKTKKMQSDLIRSKDADKFINGKKIPKNKGVWESFLRQGARAAEIYIGDKLGGPIGAIIGGMVGEKFNQKLNQKFGRNIFETKEMKAAMDVLRDTKPKAYQNLVEKLKERNVQVPKEEEKNPGKKGLVNLVNKFESKTKIQKGFITPPKSGARKGEREIKPGEVMKPGKKIRMDTATGKNYVSD